MFQLIVFDLDGTLLDTRPAMARCGNAALKACGLPTFLKEAYARFSGGGVEDFVGGILRAAGDREGKYFDLFWKTYLAEQNRDPQAGNTPFAGVAELILACRQKGLKIAALSNKDHVSCVEILEKNFGKDAFDLIRGNLPQVPPKPDPAGAEAILRHFGVLSQNCLYVGDTEVDMQTGKNARLFTVAALWGYRTREELHRFAPDFEAESPASILSLLPK